MALLLKGGGSENVSIQYSLPYEPLKAGRDLEGVRRVVLDAVHRAQGEGCAPGILGVCIGGDRGTAYTYAKMQLLRPLDDVNPLPELAALEARLLRECNELGVGPMGFGGKTTILGVKIGAAHRLPACYFVTVAYVLGMPPGPDGGQERECGVLLAQEEKFMATVQLTVPISEEAVRSLQVGDTVYLSGVIVTGRDAAHKYMVETFIRSAAVPESERALYEELRRLLAGSAIYHCGPVVRQREDGRWEFVAAGPTTSIREEPYQADVIAHFGLRGVIGKGGMGSRTLRACQEYGAVYLHAVGGAATLIADAVKEVLTVYKKDEFGGTGGLLGHPGGESPLVVTMDSHGRSIHEEVRAVSGERLQQLLGISAQ